MFKLKKSSIKTPTFFKKTFFSFLTITLIMTLLLTFLLSANYLKTTIALIHKFNENLLQQSNYSVTYLNERLERLSIALTTDKDIIGFLNMKSRDSLTPISASKVINNHLLTFGYIDSIYLYNTNLDLFFSSENGEQSYSDTFHDTNIVDLIKDEAFRMSYKGEPIYRNISDSLNTAQTCSYIIFEKNQNDIGPSSAIVINIDTKILTESIKSINQFGQGIDMSFVVSDQDGTILSSYFSQSFQNTDDILLELQEIIKTPTPMNKRFFTVDGTHYLLSSNSNNLNNWLLISLVPTNIIFKDVFYTSIISIIIVFVVFLLCSYIGLVFTKKLNAPLKTITQLVSEEKLDSPSTDSLNTSEFQFLVSVFDSLKEQTHQMDQRHKETSYSIKQDFLNNLVSGSMIDSLERTLTKLKRLDLSYLAHNQLCMCIFKIDHYNDFLYDNNQKERWALNFAIINVITETATQYFSCETFSKDSDKFVFIIQCQDSDEYSNFQNQLEKILQEIQLNVAKYLNLSLSIAYSHFFRGLENLPITYNFLDNAILLRMNHGHSCIISPDMLAEINTDSFEIPIEKEDLLLQKMMDNQCHVALEIYKQISDQLFQYNYNEVMHCLIHLMYTVYTYIITKMPHIKTEVTLLLKQFIQDLQNAEVSTEVDTLMEHFITELCFKVDSFKANSKQQTSQIIIQRIFDIIEKEYTDPNLCLNSIAEQLGLSSNYIGHLFKSNHDKSIAQYIFDFRMEKLDYYMNHTDLSLSSIVEKVGLEKNNYFYTKFKKHFGMSLGEYKLKISEKKYTQ